MREIWSPDVAEFHGQFVDFDPFWSWPKLLQIPGPKILLGCKGSRSYDVVIGYCDDWMPIGSPGKEQDLANGIDVLRLRCDAAGRSVDSLELAVVGLPGERETARRHMEIGCRHLIFSLAAANRDFSIRALDRCADVASPLPASIT